MTETPPPTTYPWLTPEAVLDWLQLTTESPLAGVAEFCRTASAAYCERQRRDLLDEVTDPETGETVVTFDADPDVVMAGLIGAARVFARRSTPAGLASYGEFGAAEVLRLDPDVSRLLGTGRHGVPRVG